MGSQLSQEIERISELRPYRVRYKITAPERVTDIAKAMKEFVLWRKDCDLGMPDAPRRDGPLVMLDRFEALADAQHAAELDCNTKEVDPLPVLIWADADE